MAFPQETRDKLRRAYIFSQMSLEVAAAQAGVSFVTARRWKKEAQDKNDDWDKMRTAHMLAGGGVEDAGRAVLMSLVVQCQTVTEQINTNPDIAPVPVWTCLPVWQMPLTKRYQPAKRYCRKPISLPRLLM